MALVVVVDLEGAIEPAHGLAHRRFGFDQHQRKSVHQQHQIGAAFGWAGTNGELSGNDVLVLLGILQIKQADSDVLVVRPKGHRAVAPQPGRHLFVSLDQPVRTHREHDGAQLVDHLIGPVRDGGDLGVEVNQRFPNPGLNEHLVGQAGNVGRREVVPAKSCDLAVLSREAETNSCVGAKATGEEVSEEVFDGCGFVESHRMQNSANTFFAKSEAELARA